MRALPPFVLAVLAVSASLGSLAGVQVEVEEAVYTFTPANNGSGPMWSSGCTQIARLGDDVYISEMETGEGVPKLCNTRWRLLRRAANGWECVAQPDGYRQREPCPLATLPGGALFLNVNDSTQPAGTEYGPCEPALIAFTFGGPEAAQRQLVPDWGAPPYFTDHSYRGFAADPALRQLLMLNIDAKTSVQHACLLSEDGKTLASASVAFPIRACYPQAALRDGAAYVFAVGDVVEPVKEWREYKFEQTKQAWDYVFRILYFTWTPGGVTGGFSTPVEIANVDATGGGVRNQDLWISPSGEAYLLYTEQEVASPLLRDRFFPGKSVASSLKLAVVKNGGVVSRRTLVAGGAAVDAGCARFHTAADGTLHAVVYVSGADTGNKLMQILPELENPPLTPIPLKSPMGAFCLAGVRAGNAPSDLLDMHGQTTGNTMSYARVSLR